MGDIELGKCDFCKKEKSLSRLYLHSCSSKSNFVIVYYCNDCGLPSELKETSNKFDYKSRATETK